MKYSYVFPCGVNEKSVGDVIVDFFRQFYADSSVEITLYIGTIYVSSGNMQGDFVKTDLENKVTNAHVVVAGDTGYIWTDQSSNKGYKMLASLMASSTTLSNSPEGIDMNQPMTYSCTNWTADQSKFVPPTNVQFTDISTFMRKSESAASNPNSCAKCANLPATYKAKCLAALHC